MTESAANIDLTNTKHASPSQDKRKPTMEMPELDKYKPRASPEGIQRKRPPTCCIQWSKGGKFRPSYTDLGFTPLHMAIVNRAPRMMLSVLARSGFINTKSKDGFTPLHLAVILTPDYFTIRTLTQAGAHLSVVDDLQRTPLEFAAYLNHYDAIDAILDASYESFSDMNPWWVFNYTKPKILDKTNLLFFRSIYRPQMGMDSPYKLAWQGNFDSKNKSDRAYAAIGQAHTALHFAVSGIYHRTCNDCLPDWRPRDHSHAYTVGDDGNDQEERTDVQKAHEGDVISRMMYAVLANSRKLYMYNTRWAAIDSCSPEQQEYLAFFTNLCDTENKTAMDYVVFDPDLTAEEKIKLLKQLSHWGGRFTTWKKSTLSKRVGDVDDKIQGKNLDSRIVDLLHEEPPAWQKELTFEIVIPNNWDQKDPPTPPRRSPIEATKELFEDAALYGLQAAIAMSRDPVERNKMSKDADAAVESSVNFEISHSMITIK